jgi:hypothetical protein
MFRGRGKPYPAAAKTRDRPAESVSAGFPFSADLGQVGFKLAKGRLQADFRLAMALRSELRRTRFLKPSFDRLI